ncbi:hypothetical protein EES47_26035 [Streptomyces sp. ADI98-12]|nr:hypothetical protein EES47_26035 [Streptomyces sp. ADI98-12]
MCSEGGRDRPEGSGNAGAAYRISGHPVPVDAMKQVGFVVLLTSGNVHVFGRAIAPANGWIGESANQPAAAPSGLSACVSDGVDRDPGLGEPGRRLAGQCGVGHQDVDAVQFADLREGTPAHLR